MLLLIPRMKKKFSLVGDSYNSIVMKLKSNITLIVENQSNFNKMTQQIDVTTVMNPTVTNQLV